MKTAVLLAILMLFAGCSGDERQATPATGHPPADARSQRDLAADIAGAEELPRAQADARYGRIRRSWLGRRVRWTVDVLPALCRSAGTCHALPFDRRGADRGIVQGWMPRLRLDGAAFAALQARCAGRRRCPVTIEATVSELALSAEQPTSLTLADVVVAAPGAGT